MRREDIEAVLREAGQFARDSEFFMIGSQAAHAYTVKLPAEVLLSKECDIYPKNRPESVLFLIKKLGPKSRFARQNGYYADVVTPDLATLPSGWESRVKPLRFGPVTALCLDIHDLVISKLAAARLKDLEFAAAILHLKLAKKATLLKRIAQLDSERDRSNVLAHLQVVLNDLRSARRSGRRK
jgi:hypothetical protein